MNPHFLFSQLYRKAANKLLLASALLLSTGTLTSSAQGIYNFYGTTKQGGPNDYGTIFKTGSNGTNAEVQFTFPTNAPGNGPTGGLTEYNGKLYGLTGSGGVNSNGVLFEFDPATSAYSKKADFNDAMTGSYPHGGLLLYNSKLYGTTSSGGAYGYGVLFEYDPATGALTNMADFDYSTVGAYPQGKPVVSGGKLYGTASSGGTNSSGLIYEYDFSTGVLSDAVDFNSTTTGSNPQSDLIVYNSKLYGTASAGGANAYGNLFEFDPSTASLTNIADFSYSDGAYPVGGLVEYNSVFYGVTSDGGNNFGGTIYEFDPSTGTLTKDADLDYSTVGGGGLNALTVYNSKLYSLVNNGGATYSGTLIEYDPATAMLSNAGDFDYSTIGSSPTGALALYNGVLYGFANSGGATGNGTIISYSTTVSKLLDFNAYLAGATPRRGFLNYNGKLYGVTSAGGAEGSGTLFEYDPAANAYTKKADLAYNTSGASPVGDLILENGKLYGMASSGGANGDGTIYEYDLTSGTLSGKVDFDYNTSGSNPTGKLEAYNGKLYGMTTYGGANGDGTVIEYDPSTSTLSVKSDFNNNTIGSNPMGSLIAYNGKLYGLANSGGGSFNGTVIEFDPATSSLTAVADFDYTTMGAYPEGSLTLAGTKLYGIANQGGGNGDGTIFSFEPATNTLTGLADFSYSTTGYGSTGGLTMYKGKFYGVSVGGGANFDGVLFEYDTTTGTLSAKTDFDYSTIGAQPSGDLAIAPARPAPGTGNTCESELSVTGSGSDWLAITDAADNAVAEINPNGNSLGSVSTDLYVNTGAVREDASNKLFLDRNVTITPVNQPSSNVDVRIYISEAEYQTLKNATNSLSQPSGISTMNDLALFKSSNSCSGTLPSAVTQLATTVAAWAGGGYVLSASVSSFSTFYIGASTSTPLPVTLLDVAAKNKGAVNEVVWNTAGEHGMSTIYLERSANARDFYTVVAMPAKGNNSRYSYTDEEPFKGINYYRLRLSDGAGEKPSYSKVVTAIVSGGAVAQVLVYPNPVNDRLSIETSSTAPMSAILKDVTGGTVKSFTITNGKTEVNVSDLTSGVYMLIYTDGNTTNAIRIVK